MRTTTRNAFHLFALISTVIIASPIDAQGANLSVMTFNVWSAENTAAGRDKIVDIIRAGGADIVGVQELASSALPEIAGALGYEFYQQSGGDIQILSRYPVVGTSPAGLGVEVAFAPDQHVWIFNAHLAAYPYQPYDLQNGSLPQNEDAVISAANAARGGQVSSYLSDLSGAMASGAPVFYTGDFNEPSHLDWTQAAADATERTFDLEVAYPASSRITAAGLTDSLRAVRPDEVNDTAYTWTPGEPPPNVRFDEVHDRIDIIYHAGPVVALDAFTIGFDASNPNTDVGVEGYNADHRAVVAEYQLATVSFLPGDVNLDGMLSGDGNGPWESDDVTAFITGWMTVSPLDDIETRWTKGDLNLNGQSGIDDVLLFQEALLGAGLNFPGFGPFVPEPSSFGLGLMAIVSACAAVCRRQTGRAT